MSALKKAQPRITKAQRMALLTCRTADRFRFDGNRPPAPSKEEAREEQHAASASFGGDVPGNTYLELQASGLLVWRNGWRLTDAGRAALKASK